ncbi:SGNH/GDSL hydrolase family protein [Pyxidicoccus parkwayensis]|uniref:SGNH/GDSL hydrolase family protein n=1 Tax=Pyxidicoccus parkwayensis TaxID=2813578 RepID=A0ABX7P3G8_9BACT|nr:SGNH/GDSL hydrolase family protein [Pyxidicoccus parkwaysis]QSQ25012.1 SGNH/GDSL hydrolase family protein [Pyxidicoccus parkwaysis]
MAIVEHISDLVLAPLYVAQAVYARKNTPRLPEPVGARMGRIGSGAELRLLVAGDSSAAGVGVSSQADALTGQLTRRLADRFSVSWRLVAESGLTTTGIADLLERTAPAAFDVAVVAAGGNDITHRVPVARWLQELERLIGLLSTRFAARRILLSPLPPMHEFPALPPPLRGYVGRRARDYNAGLSEFVRSQAACTLLVDAFAPRSPAVPIKELMSPDGFHPGAPVYAGWAECAAAAIHADPGFLPRHGE